MWNDFKRIQNGNQLALKETNKISAKRTTTREKRTPNKNNIEEIKNQIRQLETNEDVEKVLLIKNIISIYEKAEKKLSISAIMFIGEIAGNLKSVPRTNLKKMKKEVIERIQKL